MMQTYIKINQPEADLQTSNLSNKFISISNLNGLSEDRDVSKLTFNFSHVKLPAVFDFFNFDQDFQ